MLVSVCITQGYVRLSEHVSSVLIGWAELYLIVEGILPGCSAKYVSVVVFEFICVPRQK